MPKCRLWSTTGLGLSQASLKRLEGGVPGRTGAAESPSGKRWGGRTKQATCKAKARGAEVSDAAHQRREVAAKTRRWRRERATVCLGPGVACG